jgi:hypothetical protein
MKEDRALFPFLELECSNWDLNPRTIRVQANTLTTQPHHSHLLFLFFDYFQEQKRSKFILVEK